jgi:PHD/YefM family antitoxin component YafN of YafNO toxin-antitoxin module
LKPLTAKEGKYRFGRLNHLSRAERRAVTTHDRPVVVVVAAEEFERFNAPETPATAWELKTKANR